MNLKKALKVLKEYQLWRLGEQTEMIHPKQVTEAINIAIAELEKNEKFDLNSLPGVIPKSNNLKS
jgi:hypothetical protein